MRRALAVGLFGTAKDFFDAVCKYPGDRLADHPALVFGGGKVRTAGGVIQFASGVKILIEHLS